jgi:protein TonB
MNGHHDLLAQRESLRLPFVESFLAHAAIFGYAIFYSFVLMHNRVHFGSESAVPGGAVPINIVGNIPLAPAQTAFENPVANNTHSSVPTPPPTQAKAQAKVAEPEEDAIALPGKAKKAAQRVQDKKFRPYVPDRDNQLYAMKGMGVNTPSYGAPQQNAFGMGVGIGSGSPFGAYFGWYAEALQRRIGEQWQKELTQLDQGISNPPRTVVFFEIQRDGSLRNIRISQSSGNPAVDFAAMRAINQSNPVPPLPNGLAKNYVSTEVWFQIKR